MRLIAFVTEGTQIEKILNQIGVDSEPPHIAPPRGPPLWEDGGDALWMKGRTSSICLCCAPHLVAASHPDGAALVKALEQERDGFVACCAGEAGCSTPEAADHLFDELLLAVPPVGALR